MKDNSKETSMKTIVYTFLLCAFIVIFLNIIKLILNN
jgi:hypothetical protein